MKVDIITPESVLYTGDSIHLVQLPGVDGSFEIMDHHAPLISVLKNGKIKVVVKGAPAKYFDVKGGVLEVQNNTVLILAE